MMFPDRNLRMFPAVFFCVVLTFASVVGSTGFRGRVTRHGLNYASQVAVDLLMKQLPNASIPDIYEKMRSMSIVLSNVTLKEYRRPTLRVDLIPNSTTSFAGLKVTFSHLDPEIECDMAMSYDFGLFTTERQLFVNIATTNLTLKLEALVGTDGNGNAIPGKISCSIEGDVRMASGAETGTLGGIFDMMTSSMNEMIKGIMFNQACTNITALVNNTIHREMSAANMSRVILDQDYFLDLTFTEPPFATDGYFEASHVAKLYLRNDSRPAGRRPLSSPVIPALSEHTAKMTYAFVTNHVLNAAWSAALRNKDLAYTARSNMPGFPRKFRQLMASRCSTGSSGCLGTVFPQLNVLYPRSIIELELEATESSNPIVRIRGRTLEIRTQGTVNFFATLQRTRNPLFSMDLVVSGQMKVQTSGEKIIFNLKRLSLNANTTRIHLPNSTISTTNSDFQSFLQTVRSRFLLPYLKKLGSRGYQIPSLPWFKVTNPVVFDSQLEDLLVLGADFTFNVDAIPGLKV